MSLAPAVPAQPGDTGAGTLLLRPGPKRRSAGPAFRGDNARGMPRSHLLTRTRIETGRDAWQAFVEASEEAWLWHHYDLQDALAAWPGRHDLSFAVHDPDAGGRIVAIVPLHLQEGRAAGFLRWDVLDSLGGPACQNGLGTAYKRKVLAVARDSLASLARRHDAVKIDLALSPMAPALRGPACPRANPLLDLGCENTLTHTWVTDLCRPPEAIRAAYSTLTKRELRAAQLSPYEIREAAGAADLATYYELHCRTYHRTGAIPHPLRYFQIIFEEFVPAGLSRVVFLVREGRVLAAQNTGRFKGACVYWTGASCSDRDGGENRLLFDEQIFHAADHGFTWYELGEAFPNVEQGKLKGLNDFKRSFGGSLYPYYRGRIVLKKRWHASLALYRALRGQA